MRPEHLLGCECAVVIGSATGPRRLTVARRPQAGKIFQQTMFDPPVSAPRKRMDVVPCEAV